MKKLSTVFALIAVSLIFSGCTTTTTLVTYDSQGNVLSETTTEADPVSKIMDEMTVKDIAWWTCGWWFDIELTLISKETYTPTIAFRGANANRGHISLTKDSKQDLAECIKAMQNALQVEVNEQGIKIKED